MGIGHITAAFLATKLMCAHHIFSILLEVDLIDSHIGVPQLSMPKRQSSLPVLVFGLARLIPFVAPNIVRFYPANLQDTFRILRVILVQKYPQKNFSVPKSCIWFKIKTLFDEHQIFNASTVEMVTYVFLSVECYKFAQTMQNQVFTSLLLSGKQGKTDPFTVRKVCCPYASFHYWPPDPHANLLVYVQQYNCWLKSVREMTPL